jgi:hypothetical protein
LRIDEDVYSVARALARSEHISIGRAINQLARQGFQRVPSKRLPSKRRAADFPVSPGKRLFTAEDVQNIAFDDVRTLEK